MADVFLDALKIFSGIVDNVAVNGIQVYKVPSPTPTPTPAPAPVPVVTTDKGGITFIYPPAGDDWAFNTTSPTVDPRLTNEPALVKQASGGWREGVSQMRIEAQSLLSQKWTEVSGGVEASAIIGIVGLSTTGSYCAQLYGLGGHHTDNNQCLGGCYKLRLFNDGKMCWEKEHQHPKYNKNRNIITVTTTALKGRKIGMKAVIKKKKDLAGKWYIRLEGYYNDNGDGKTWKLGPVTEDHGDWTYTGTDFVTTCPRRDTNKIGPYQTPSDILLTGGGTATQNICALRNDDAIMDIYKFTVHEIKST